MTILITFDNSQKMLHHIFHRWTGLSVCDVVPIAINPVVFQVFWVLKNLQKWYQYHNILEDLHVTILKEQTLTQSSLFSATLLSWVTIHMSTHLFGHPLVQSQTLILQIMFAVGLCMNIDPLKSLPSCYIPVINNSKVATMGTWITSQCKWTWNYLVASDAHSKPLITNTFIFFY